MKRVMKIGRAATGIVLLLMVAVALIWFSLPVKAVPLDTYH